MAIQFSSPGIDVREIDKSISVEAPGVSSIGTVGESSWGAAFEPLYINTELNLQALIGKPKPRNAKSYKTCDDILSYTRSLVFVRALDRASAKNATIHDSTAGLLIENRSAFETISKSTKQGHKFAAKYAGTLGNSLEVSMADSKTFENWQYAYLFSDKPGTSSYAQSVGAKNDEVHVVVIDRAGLFTGIPNTVLEVYEFLSKARDGKSLDLNSMYFETKINEESDYIYFLSLPTEYDTSVSEENTEWGTTLLDHTTGKPANFKSLKMPEHGADGTSAPSKTNLHKGYGGVLSGGSDGDELGDEDYIAGWSIFKNAEETAVNLLTLGAVPDEHNITVAQYINDHIITKRQDCVLCVSPKLSDVLNKSEDEAVKNVIKYFTDLNRQSSYMVLTCNWFLEYDQHTDANYWIPDCVGTAGLMARTDETNDPWFSPAGYTRGVYKNVIKTAWNPSEEAADQMYKYSINRVSNFRGHGTLLYGDRTMITRPSALRQIGVRRLLIVLRKQIADATRYSLFEFNDSITRNRFISLVTPFLLQVQAGRGLASFKVVCDETNNTPQVIDEQQFVGDIYIRPLYSINRIKLNFILVNNTVSFTEAGA